MNLNDLALDLFCSHLNHQGIKTNVSDRVVTLDIQNLQCYLEVEETGGDDSASTVMVAFSLMFDENNIIRDKILGIGTNEQEAVLSSVEQWVDGILAPAVELCAPGFLKTDLPSIQLASKTGDKYMSWAVIMGPVQSNDADGTLMRHFDETPPFCLAINTITGCLDQPWLHWVKLFLCRFPNNHLEGEVRIDNDVDEAGFDELSQFKWPTSQPLIWFRQFAMIVPAKELSEREFRQLAAGAS
jgi:hypothetical protein